MLDKTRGFMCITFELILTYGNGVIVDNLRIC